MYSAFSVCKLIPLLGFPPGALPLDPLGVFCPQSPLGPSPQTKIPGTMICYTQYLTESLWLVFNCMHTDTAIDQIIIVFM